MKKIRDIVITLIIMLFISFVCLLIVSTLSYLYKWQADKALIGITITYILAGFTGGLMQKRQDKEKKGVGRKMLEGILISSIFMGILVILSFFLIQQPFVFSSRFIMIWMLLMGSACLGRIL